MFLNAPNLLIGVAAQPLHEDVGVEAVGGTAKELVDGVGVVLFNISNLL